MCKYPAMVLIILSLLFTPKSSFANDLKLDDLKFDAKDLKVDAVEQAKLEKRESMLNLHQIMGITTLTLMTATFLTAEEGHDEHTGNPKAAPSIHKWLGIASGVSYFTTAGLSLLAPEPKDEKPSTGSTKWHKRLVWVHFPAMVLTTALGLMANHKLEKGEKLTGILESKSTVASIAYFSVLAAGLTMTFDF